MVPYLVHGVPRDPGKFQYIYGMNRDPSEEQKCSFYGCCIHKTYISPEPFEANTGYYYVSAKKKSAGIRALWRAALDECAARPDMDDQTNFWAARRPCTWPSYSRLRLATVRRIWYPSVRVG